MDKTETLKNLVDWLRAVIYQRAVGFLKLLSLYLCYASLIMLDKRYSHNNASNSHFLLVPSFFKAACTRSPW